MYVHLTTHSAYSLQEALPLPSEIIQAAVENQMPAVGLTDHRLLTGAVEFVLAAQKSGIQPVLGLEIDTITGKLALLATSLLGWANLCRLSSAIALQPDASWPCNQELLESFSADLICLSGDQGDKSGARLGELKTLFGDRLYLNLSEPGQALRMASLGHKLGIQCVVSHPVYYLRPDQKNLQRVLTAIRLNTPIAEISSRDLTPEDACFLSREVMEHRYSHFPAALNATNEIVLRCKVNLPLGTAKMPTVPIPNGYTAEQYLRQKAYEGARRLYGPISPEVQSRLEEELKVISRMGFEPIFLIVEEILNFARQEQIPYSSRGSAASSLVAHSLGITSPDPLELNLFFERFLNPARSTPPDIDTDLCSRQRDRVIQHVFDTYGAERVAMVGTINRFRPRSALADVAKAHGIKPSRVREMANQLPHAFFAKRMEEEASSQSESPFVGLRALYPSPSDQSIIDEAEALLKLPRHLSVHAGGLIVAPGPITDFVPIMRSGSKGIIITQLDLGHVEALGLVKIDLLGIRGLTVLGDVGEWVAKRYPGLNPGRLEILDAIPAGDPGTVKTVEDGRTIGCFQIESPGMRATLREIHAQSEMDIMAALALYRPGPLSGGLKDAFVRRFKGEEAIHHLHPALAPVLDETLGVILYQEQVLKIAHELAGFSLAEADLLRRAMSHFDPGKQMQALERKFIDGSQYKSAVPEETAKRLWDMMAAFSGYGFPKAHAASYARIAWRSAWCKTHFPAEFMAAVLANWGGYYNQRVYLNEARLLNLTVHPPHVSYSQNQFSVGKNDQPENCAGVLYMGFDQIKGLTQRTITKIIQNQPFYSLEDFLTRVNPRLPEAQNLARIGAFEGLGIIPAILERLETGAWQQGQMSLFDAMKIDEQDWSLDQKVAAQENLLGISLDAHPLELLENKLRTAGVISIVEAAGRIGQRVLLAGLRQNMRRSRTSKGESMAFISFDDLSGTMDGVIFPDVYRQVKPALVGAGPYLLGGVIETSADNIEPYLRIQKIEPI